MLELPSDQQYHVHSPHYKLDAACECFIFYFFLFFFSFKHIPHCGRYRLKDLYPRERYQWERSYHKPPDLNFDALATPLCATDLVPIQVWNPPTAQYCLRSPKHNALCARECVNVVYVRFFLKHTMCCLFCFLISTYCHRYA